MSDQRVLSILVTLFGFEHQSKDDRGSGVYPDNPLKLRRLARRGPSWLDERIFCEEVSTTLSKSKPWIA